MARCVTVLCAAIAGVCALEGVARADSFERQSSTEPLQLRWEAPPGCPRASDVRKKVIELAEIEGSDARRLRAHVVIRRDAGAWRLELTTDYDGMAGERALSAKSCQTLTDAATLTLALMLNPDVELPRESSDGTASFRLALSARAGVAEGILRKFGADFALGVGVVGNGPSLWASASFAPPQAAHVSGSSGPGGRIWAGSAALFGCWDFFEATPLGPCAGAELTRVAGHGIGVANPDDAAAYFASGLVGVRSGFRLSKRLTLRIQGFALVPAQRPSLFLEEVGLVVRPDPVGARVQAGADVEL